jgi:hypothetical protein
MSENTPSAAAIPPGWYDDGTGSGRMRWWSGTDWTEHVAGGSSNAPARPALPADRPVYGVWIWLIVLLPLLSSVSLLFYRPNFDYLSTGSLSSRVYPTSMFTPAYFLIALLGWAVYGASVFFAYRDVVWLRKQGVVRPFHWAWTFLLSWVYVIGRSVIVHRVAAPRGRVPIWVLIVVIVTRFVIAIAWTVTLMTGVMAHLPTYSGPYSS